MRQALKNRPLRLVVCGNFISMLGSGMNTAAVGWYILQETHTAVSLGTLALLQAAPTLLVSIFSGVLIDRCNRRRLAIALDAIRAGTVGLLALLAFSHRVEVWQLYGMAMLVAAASWIFFPNMNAYVQEVTPERDMAAANTWLKAGMQAGFMLAGALMGVLYNRGGLALVLSVDSLSYGFSLACYWMAGGAERAGAPMHGGRHVLARWVAETREGFEYLRANTRIVLLNVASAIFFGLMLAQNVAIPPLAQRVLHTDAVGYGWLNAAWAIGAIGIAAVTPKLIHRFGVKRTTIAATAVLAAGSALAPFTELLGVALSLFLALGAARSVGIVAVATETMRTVPPGYMGRVQNLFAVFALVLQMTLGFALGFAVQTAGVASGFALIALVYGLAACAALMAKSETAAAPSALVATAK
jgi:MFS family permease